MQHSVLQQQEQALPINGRLALPVVLVHGRDIPGATSSCFTATAVSATANGNAYQCIVSGTCTPAVTTACATLTVNTAAAITAQPVNTSGCTGGNATFSVTATGSGLTYNWQVSTDGGVTWNNVSPAATTATLTLTNVTAAMTNNQYRCQVGGSCSAGLINSNAAVLSLSNSITFSTQPVSAGVCAGTDVTFTVAASGTGLAYNWQVSTDGGTTWNNVAPANTTNTLNNTLHNSEPGWQLFLPVVQGWRFSSIFNYADKFAVTVDDLGTYDVIVTDNLTGCASNISNRASVDYVESSELFIYPNPSSGSFQVRYFSSSSTTARTLNIYDSKGARVYQKAYTITSPYTKMDVNMDNAASDVYLVELRDAGGKRIATGKIVIR
jgi:hypothetical protein